MSIEASKAAPLFTLPDHNGNKVSLKNLKGSYVVVYFYPRYDTPGCTKEAISFKDLQPEFKKLHAIVIGISPDTPESHEKFIGKYDLNFTLLCDETKKVMEKYGAWGEKMMYGKKTVGVIRSTALIDPKGKVVKHWARVSKAADHPGKVLEALQAL